MNNIFRALLIGCIASLIDVISMIIQKHDKRDCISAFIHYFALGLIIPFVDWEFQHGLKG